MTKSEQKTSTVDKAM